MLLFNLKMYVLRNCFDLSFFIIAVIVIVIIIIVIIIIIIIIVVVVVVIGAEGWEWVFFYSSFRN